MKKALSIALSVMAISSMVYAKGGNHPMAGCGLGYVLFGNTDNSKMMQIFGGTTNATFGNQTFGITSGTSGCTEDGAVKFVKEAEVYAEVNLDTLRREMAAGQGEFVTSFAVLLGAKGDQVGNMVAFFHDQYATLFPTSNVSSSELLENLKGSLATRPELIG